MKFEEAIYYFKQGATIKRHKWPSYDIFYINEKEVTKYALSKEDYLADDWEIVNKIEEPGKSFPEVFEAFKAGKSIRRKDWDDNVFISVKGLFFDVNYGPVSFCEDDSLSIKDLLATDWEIIND